MPNFGKILKMKDPSGFDRLWEQEVRKGKKYREAFWDLENEYRDFVQENGLEDELDKNYRYKDYQSYRQSRRKRIKG